MKPPSQSLENGHVFLCTHIIPFSVYVRYLNVRGNSITDCLLNNYREQLSSIRKLQCIDSIVLTTKTNMNIRGKKHVITVNEIINDKHFYLTYLEIRYFKMHTLLFES